MHNYKMKVFCLLVGLLVVVTTTFPTIHTLDAFDNLISVVKEGDSELVIFDIDNTLLLLCDERANERFFFEGIKRNIADGKSPEEALKIQIQIFVDVCSEAPVKVTDERLPLVWKTLFEKGVKFLLLTARTPVGSQVETTFRQLHSLGLDLTINENAWNQSYLFPDLGADVLYDHGILFVGNQNKGVVLKAFLDKIGYQPKHIYFVDDGIKNLHNVGKMAEQYEIAYDGFHFTKGLEMLAAERAV